MNSITQHWNYPQPDEPGDRLLPRHTDAEMWVNARVGFPHALSSEWGVVDYAKRDYRGRIWLHIVPDDAALMARWRLLDDRMSVE